MFNSLSSSEQRIMLDYLIIIQELFRRYGSKLHDQSIRTHINHASPEINQIIDFVVHHGGFDHVGQWITELTLLLPESIQTIKNPNNQIGVKIISTHGKQYMRTLTKDLDTLIHST
ncbi:MAG TPA: hypothetical protein PLW93_04075 [Candidatus Absconditabacterales bacterium]|nr:hypothetical protein [Candidatus Absconditabacterales bacterium]HNG97420.1 hypothetical protein [Candidatus Absconditabacterales bacterium]